MSTDPKQRPSDDQAQERVGTSFVEGAGAAKVRLYTKAFCPYCMTAKRILGERGFSWNEIRVDDDPSMMDEMIRRSGGGTTVPQIFINRRYLGGLDELMMVDHLKEWPLYLGGGAHLVEGAT